MFAEGKQGRRDFIRSAFAAAGAAVASPIARATPNPVPADGGDPNILNLPEHSKGLGQPVVTDGYGKPSKYEANVQRRQSPGLTQTTQASVSFAPLQSLFGIVTPSGLHFERHHQGWWDIDPSKHRLMVNGSDARSSSRRGLHDGRADAAAVGRRASTSSNAAPTPAWSGATSRCRPCQYTHGMLSCSEFTGVPLTHAARDVRRRSTSAAASCSPKAPTARR